MKNEDFRGRPIFYGSADPRGKTTSKHRFHRLYRRFKEMMPFFQFASLVIQFFDHR